VNGDFKKGTWYIFFLKKTPLLKFFIPDNNIFESSEGFSKFCQQTTLHGWAYLDSEPGFLRKVIWIVVLVKPQSGFGLDPGANPTTFEFTATAPAL
jgi:hypothetical protein